MDLGHPNQLVRQIMQPIGSGRHCPGEDWAASHAARGNALGFACSIHMFMPAGLPLAHQHWPVPGPGSWWPIPSQRRWSALCAASADARLTHREWSLVAIVTCCSLLVELASWVRVQQTLKRVRLDCFWDQQADVRPFASQRSNSLADHMPHTLLGLS
jgi:hypothetical protein